MLLNDLPNMPLVAGVMTSYKCVFLGTNTLEEPPASVIRVGDSFCYQDNGSSRC